MSVAAGLAVMQAMFDAEINAIAGSKGKPTHMMRRESSRLGDPRRPRVRAPAGRPR